MTRYRTIVVDPPWRYERFARNVGGRYGDGTQEGWEARVLPYGSMAVDEIKALPVERIADPDCRLFLWTTNRYLPNAFDVAAAWGFDYRQALIWHKVGNPNPWIAHVAPNHAEFLLVCVKGKPERLAHLPTNVLAVDANPARLRHSQKPDAFLDYVEQVSPGPYAELFARRARFGWEYPIGDQALGGVAA